MGVQAMRVFEYSIECDGCGFYEVYHTYDQDNGVTVHSIPSAIRAARFHKSKGKIYCPICYENILFERSHKHG